MIPPHARLAASFAMTFALAGCGASAPPSGQDAAVADAVEVGALVDAPIAPADLPLTDADAPAADLGGTADVVTSPPPPTTGAADIERWLAMGAYRAWRCEPERHAARPGSAHSANRICTNETLSASEGAGEFPVGSAAVKELFNSAGTLTGYAVSVRVREGGGGAGWYWYERLAPGRVVADSTGDRGGARTICVSCHDGAPRDQVYTVVR
jgi:hypothetical protein